MTCALRLWPLLTGTMRYEKVVSTRHRGQGELIEAPILAYLIEASNGRSLYDVSCDYRKVVTPELRARFFDPMRPRLEPPCMSGVHKTLGREPRAELWPNHDLAFFASLSPFPASRD